ncbi:probable phospholipid-transporting ATPase IA isoform X2 [Panonychus citri]|uniref:probable phospholipid-transporting ATPase IA isoform X2 n=1 Tax=Panonychus citri TaxID=50023 RepID=UPI0023077E04|nr:probable phospholipid-transporting ATPase IA isoform X2 [Panonychus citri]
MMERLEGDESSHTRTITPITGNQAPRLIYITGKHKFCSNRISTGKYNVFSFMPKFLFEQFRRYSNVFFLIIALLQQIPNVSPTGRYTTAVPLFSILAVSALKEIFEDIKRHRADRTVNRSKALVLNKFTNQWEMKFWMDIMVGDVIKVKNDGFFPADLLLLSSSEPNGMCYIETANLDGETNLKIRQSLAATYHCVTSEQLVNDLSLASVSCEPPNKHLYEFHGNLKVGDTLYPINPDQILLRGAKLKNTNWIFGTALYTGHETKLMMNSMLQAPLKQSRVEKLTNSQILNLFGILLSIGAISTIANLIWNNGSENHWYLDEKSSSSNFAYTFLTFFILYNNLIPISLQVTLEVVRFVQAHFINSDLEMYCPESDTPAMARTSNLNEELGQVRYILSDKTGTLTRNVMEFRQCSIAGIIFSTEEAEKMVNLINTSQEKGHYVREFLTLMAICHTVVPEKNSDETSDSNGIKYQAASPDEGALVKGASNIGFKFTTRTPDYVYINALGREEKYQILNVLEFNSERKRMSVIVRCPDGKIKLYTKGADTVIYDRLVNNQFADVTVEHLSVFATHGLRTLCCAFSLIDERTYSDWSKEYQRAINDVSNNREETIGRVMDKIEADLNLLGATAIEDKLQEGVPETIETLLKAGIKIWVLTGDKQETAINIGHSCKLIRNTNPLIIINEESLDATREAIREVEPTPGSVLVIDGKSLKYALTSDIKAEFVDIALISTAVICCRVSPIQKAEIVDMVKSKTNEVCLAIGDGANDVAMIRAANVGVGISGNEGLQAVHSADYSIPQFRFLARLLLVHGSWSLSRLCKLILYSFYKNIALCIIELWFACVSAWSGQTIFDRWTIGLYNVFFTALPPFAIGLFDRQCSAETMIKYPGLYRIANETVFTLRLFWIWIGTAIWHSLVLFWLTYAVISNDSLWPHGLSDGGYLVFGNMLYTYVVVTVCLKAGLEISAWTWVTHATIWSSIGIWFIFLVIYSYFWPSLPIAADMLAMYKLVFSSYIFWLGLIIIPFITLLFDIVYKIVTRTCYKTLADQVLEEEKSLVASSSQQTLLTETARLIRNVFDKNRVRGRSKRDQSETNQSTGNNQRNHWLINWLFGQSTNHQDGGNRGQSSNRSRVRSDDEPIVMPTVSQRVGNQEIGLIVA